MKNLLINSGNRILSLIVAATITLSVLPITAVAQDNDTGTGMPGTSVCVCEALCLENSINADCPVYVGDYAGCAYTGVPVASPGDIGNEDGGWLNLAGDGESCVCETLCDAEAPNTDCPVCKDDYTKCAQTPTPALAAAATVTVNGTEVTVAGLVAGGLQTVIEGIVNDNTNYPGITAPGHITKLTVTGAMNSADLDYISGNLAGLTVLDLSGVTGLTTLSDFQFASHTKLQIVDLSDCTSLTSIGFGAFNYCESLQSVDLSGCASLASIGNDAFRGCASLRSVDLPESLTSIGAAAFIYCESLQSVDLSGYTDLTSIGDTAFAKCASQRSVDLSGCTGLTSIWDYAFAECASLQSVDLSGCTSLTSIGEGAFYECTSLRSVNLSGCIRQVVAISATDAFTNTSNVMVLVPIKLLSAYQSDSAWSTYNTIHLTPVCTVTFHANGGSDVSSQTVTEGGKVTKPADPTKVGCTFAEWYSDPGLLQSGISPPIPCPTT